MLGKLDRLDMSYNHQLRQLIIVVVVVVVAVVIDAVLLNCPEQSRVHDVREDRP